jgi:hypothetical protein
VSDAGVNALIERLVQARALEAGPFGDLLGVDLKPTESNPYWTFYPFKLADGPFSGGELRLKATGDGALLILDPRDPPGLGEDDIDRQALGERLGMVPNPRIPPEGIESEYFEIGVVRVAIQWTRTSRKLAGVILEWTPPSPEATAAS